MIEKTQKYKSPKYYLENCSICQSNQLSIFENYIEKQFYVLCNNCSHKGAKISSLEKQAKAKAILAWNKANIILKTTAI